MSPLSNLQALAVSAVTQIVAVIVAFGLFSTTKGQIIVSAAGSVIALLVAIYQFYENSQAVATITASAKK